MLDFVSEVSYDGSYVYKVICTKVREGDKRIVRIREGEAAGRHIVIVDDLVQSGGTLIECQVCILLVFFSAMHTWCHPTQLLLKLSFGVFFLYLCMCHRKHDIVKSDLLFIVIRYMWNCAYHTKYENLNSYSVIFILCMSSETWIVNSGPLMIPHVCIN